VSVLLDVAVDLVPLINDVVEVHEDRVAVVRDATARWLALPTTERGSTTLAEFVGEYVDRVDIGAYNGCPDPHAVRGEAADRLVFAAWQEHVRSLNAAGILDESRGC
jgi:hypothetical protein